MTDVAPPHDALPGDALRRGRWVAPPEADCEPLAEHPHALLRVEGKRLPRSGLDRREVTHRADSQES